MKLRECALLAICCWLSFGPGNLVSNVAYSAQNHSKRSLDEKLSRCRFPGLDEELWCGRYEVFEDRSTRKGRKIGLNIVVLPAKSEQVEPDPLVYLAGGGVLPATERAPFFARAFPNLRQHRDILLIDQRGTGESNRLDCDLPSPITDRSIFFDEIRYRDTIRRCRKELEAKADLRFYTTPIAMDDLDEVRQWLGYSRLNIYGMSYGTKAALVYSRQYPTRVRAIALHGPLPLDVSIWSDSAPLAQQALDNVFEACSKLDQCRSAFPNFKQEFEALLKRLAEKPVSVKVENPQGSQQIALTIDDRSIRSLVAGALSSVNAIRMLPSIIHHAFKEDYQPLAQRLIPRGRGVPRGIFLSLFCNEGAQQISTKDIQVAAGTFLGNFSIRRQLQMCQEWPKSSLPKDFFKPVKSNVPALILTGALDPTTPPRYGETALRTLANGRHLVLAGRSHNDVDPCVTGLIEAFIIIRNPETLDTSCASRQQDRTFVTEEAGMKNPELARATEIRVEPSQNLLPPITNGPPRCSW